MSGGAFDYNCFRIAEFADDLKYRIETNGESDKRGCGDDFSKETLSVLSEAYRVIRQAAKLAKEIEWLYSGDTGEDTFNELAKEILEN